MGSYQKVVNPILDMLHDHRDDYEVIIGGDFNLTVSMNDHIHAAKFMIEDGMAPSEMG